jgi:hypothetical protein
LDEKEKKNEDGNGTQMNAEKADKKFYRGGAKSATESRAF